MITNLLAQKKVDEARLEAINALALEQSPMNFYNMGLVKLATSDWDYATQCFLKAPEIYEAWLGILTCMIAQGKQEDAVKAIWLRLLGYSVKFQV